MRPIPNFPGYCCTIDGAIWSFKRNSQGKKLKPGKSTKGYVQYQLTNSEGKCKSVLGHRIVACTYLGLELSDTKTQINHISGIKTDNRVENLEPCSAKENCQHAIATGLRTIENSTTKLTAAEVTKIRDLREETGMTYKVLAKQFNVSDTTIKNIVRRQTWKHLA